MKSFKVQSKFLSSLNEALQKMSLNNEIKIIKNPILEADGNFTSVIQSTNEFNPSKINSNVFSDEIEEDESLKAKKSELTDRIIEKIKQSVDTNSELQSLLNDIKKLNIKTNENNWELNKEDNTAQLTSKNAYIFKQNDNLCLSHNGKVEIFKTVEELHNWLKQNHYPLPKDIKLHEAIDDGTFISRKNNRELSDFSKWNIENKNVKKKNIFHTDQKLDNLKKILHYFLIKSDFDNQYYKKAYKTIEDSFIDLQKDDTVYNNVLNELHNLKRAFDKDSSEELINRRKAGYGKWFNYIDLSKHNKLINQYNKNDQQPIEKEEPYQRTHYKMGKNEYNNTNSLGLFNLNQTGDLNAFSKDDASKDKFSVRDLEKVNVKKEAQLEEIWYLEYQNGNNKEYLAQNWNNQDLLTDNLSDAAKFVSREEALNTASDVYEIHDTQFPFKPINIKNESLNECGISCGMLGSAVQYLGNKSKKESVKSKFISLLGKRLKDITLTEDDKPEDFATNLGATLNNAASELSGDTKSTDDISLDNNSNDLNNQDDLNLDKKDNVSFDDINISSSGNPLEDEYGPEEDEQDIPMEPIDEYKIVDILSDSKNSERLKVKVKNLTTKETEIKDLSEIDV